MFNLDAPPAAVAEMERNMRLNEDVLRYLTVRVQALEEGPSAMLQRGRGEDRDRDRDRGGYGDRGYGDRGGYGDRDRDRGPRRDRDAEPIAAVAPEGVER